MQIRAKLALQFIALAAIIFALALLFIYAQFKKHMENELFTLLESKALMTAEMVLRHEEELLPITDSGAPSGSILPHEENTLIFDARNRCVFALVPSGIEIQEKWLSQIRNTGSSKWQNGVGQRFGAMVKGPSGKVSFDREYVVAEGLGQWRPPGDDFMPPLLPRWGKARTLIAHREDSDLEPPVDFSETPHSPFFAQAFEVYSLSLPLKDENRWIAEFWSDDIPGVTFSTASRWISIANQALEKKHPGLAVALETWLKLGLALNDAAVHIWDAKYQINLERPDTYIRRNINPDWNPLHHSPSFPGYPSGHAGFAGAAAAVLTHMLGDNFSLTDRSHQGRKEFMSKPRSYRSFDEMAEENALSRLLMGVHFRMDCEAGLKLGYAIGGKAAQLPLRCKTAALPPNEQT